MNGDHTITRNQDGTRTVTRKADGARWIERDKGDGIVERVYLEAPIEYGYVPNGAMVTAPGHIPPTTGRTYNNPAATTVTKPKPKELEPIRRWKAKDLCDIEVVVSQAVIDHIRRTMTWTTGQDGLEQGGWLVGSSFDRTVAVTNATTDSKNRKPNGVTLTGEGWMRHERVREAGVDFGPIGDWHVHPTAELWQPSRNDFEGWERVHKTVNGNEWQPYTVGIIATADERGSFNCPALTAFVVRRDRDRYVTQPANIRML